MGAVLHERIGQVLFTMPAVNGLLMGAADKDIVLIDEAHEMPQMSQTLLYRAMEDGQVFVQTPKNKTLKMRAERFTILLATTDEYALLSPLRDRCKIVLPFTYYDDDSLAVIVKQRAMMMSAPLDDAVAQAVSQRSRGTPRVAIRLLEACWRFARSVGDDHVTSGHFEKTVRLEQIDSLGLGSDEQRYPA